MEEQISGRHSGSPRAAKGLRQSQFPFFIAFLCLVFVVVAGVQTTTWSQSIVLALAQATFLISLILLPHVPDRFAGDLKTALKSISFKPTFGFGAATNLLFCVASLSILLLFPAVRNEFDVLLTKNSFSIENLIFWVVAPFGEEAFFRGLVLSYLVLFGSNHEKESKDSSYFFPVYISSLIFFLFHWPVDLNVWAEAWKAGFIPLNFGPFFLGIWLGFVCLKDSSLFWCVFGHSLANFFAPLWSLFLLNLV